MALVVASAVNRVDESSFLDSDSTCARVAAQAIPLTPALQAVPFTYRWNVHRFSGFCTGELGEQVSSPPFSSGWLGPEERWVVHLYPNGCREDRKKHIGLFVFLLQSGVPRIRASVRLALARPDGSLMTRPAQGQMCEFRPGRAGSGLADFILQSDVDEYLRDDVLTVVCRLKLFLEEEEEH